MSEINELKVQLEEKQADIALTQTAMQVNKMPLKLGLTLNKGQCRHFRYARSHQTT